MSIKSITRRGFLRGCCILTGGLTIGIHWTSRAVAGVRSIKDYMQERIASVYREDKSFTHRAPQDNEQVKALYQKFLNKPLSEKAHHLLHTKWYDKSSAVKNLADTGQYPGPRGGEFRYKKYPYEA